MLPSHHTAVCSIHESFCTCTLHVLFRELTRTHFSTVQNNTTSNLGWTLWGCAPTVARAGRVWCARAGGAGSLSWRAESRCGWSSLAEKHLEERRAKKKKKVERLWHWSAFKEQWLLLHSKFEIKCCCFWSSIGGNIWTICSRWCSGRKVCWENEVTAI